LIKLPNTGALLLSSDAVHFKDNWENRRVPDITFNKVQSAASLQRIADVLAKEKAGDGAGLLRLRLAGSLRYPNRWSGEFYFDKGKAVGG
jgi:hypothetical protein